MHERTKETRFVTEAVPQEAPASTEAAQEQRPCTQLTTSTPAPEQGRTTDPQRDIMELRQRALDGMNRARKKKNSNTVSKEAHALEESKDVCHPYSLFYGECALWDWKFGSVHEISASHWIP